METGDGHISDKGHVHKFDHIQNKPEDVMSNKNDSSLGRLYQ